MVAPRPGDAPITCQPLFREFGSENSGQNIDESLESRTSSYLVTRFRDREPGAEGPANRWEVRPEGRQKWGKPAPSPGI